MPVTPEVDSLQGEVRRDQRVPFLASAGQKSQHGAVVSYSSLNGGILRKRRYAANLGDQRFFGDYPATNISDVHLSMRNVVLRTQERPQGLRFCGPGLRPTS